LGGGEAAERIERIDPAGGVRRSHLRVAGVRLRGAAADGESGDGDERGEAQE